MIELYITWVKSNPMVSAAIQFAILGTLGEYISSRIKTGTFHMEATILQIAGKAFGWAILGIIIKYGFIGMKGFVKALIESGLVPSFCEDGFGKAALISIVTNILFGPQMMLFHRLEENIIMKESGYEGMEEPLKTLLWFWIPAHTVTFILPREYQIGLAACWSVVLGVIMGLSTPQREKQQG